MKTQLVFLFLFVFSQSFAQISYERGYFIDLNDKKTDCWIKNLDWRNNPTEFEYKLEDNSSVTKGNLKSVKEFCISRSSKFLRAEVEIDRSSDLIERISKERNPVWNKDIIFLKVLVEGKANLYFYADGNLKRYFYKVGDSEIKQLICKKYLIDDFNIATNKAYRQQLWMYVRLKDMDISYMENIDYEEKDLGKYFKKYNSDEGIPVKDYRDKEKRDAFNLRIKFGINSANMVIENKRADYLNIDFGNKKVYSFGIEAEYMLSFNKNKWGLLLEPTYQYFNSTENSNNMDVTMDYRAVDFPIGIRHYFFLNDNARIFIDGFFIYSASLEINSSLVFGNYREFDIATRNSYAFGAGFDYNRLSAEIRYYTKRNLIGDYGGYNTDYNRLSFIIGFKIF